MRTEIRNRSMVLITKKSSYRWHVAEIPRDASVSVARFFFANGESYVVDSIMASARRYRLCGSDDLRPSAITELENWRRKEIGSASISSCRVGRMDGQTDGLGQSFLLPSTPLDGLRTMYIFVRRSDGAACWSPVTASRDQQNVVHVVDHTLVQQDE